MADRVILCIGTRKGLFVAEAKKTRGRFELRGPFGEGVPVYSALVDRRGSPRLYASSCSPFFGMKGLRSTDLGKSFKETKSAPAFPRDDGRALANIWSLEAGQDGKDLWCGVEPAALFRSGDAGDSWEMVDGISNHPHARKWSPGAGGLCLHTIRLDGHRVHLGISTGGHYLSEDGGRTFAPSNKGIGAGFQPDPYPEFGQCVHKFVGHEDAPGRLYMQNPGGWANWNGPGGPRPDIGVLRSDDYGRSWRSIAKGLPSDFGFPIEEIRTLLALWNDRERSSSDVKALALARAAELKRKARELDSIRRLLEDLAARCHGDDRPDCPILGDLEAADEDDAGQPPEPLGSVKVERTVRKTHMTPR